jgi:hypothetical protein
MKWKLELDDPEDRSAIARRRVLTLAESPGLKVTVPFGDGRILSRGVWAEIVKSVNTFYAAVEGETQGLVDVAGEEINPFDAIGICRERLLRRALDRCDGGGFVYFLRGEDFCKIGQTTRLNERIAALKIQLPFKVDLFHVIPTTTPVLLERAFHQHYASKRANGEWFRLDEDDFAYIRSVARGISAVDFAIECLTEQTAICFEERMLQIENPVGYTEDGGPRFLPEEDEELSDDLRRFNARMALLGSPLRHILNGERCHQCASIVRPQGDWPKARASDFRTAATFPTGIEETA